MHCCKEMENFLQVTSLPIKYNPKFREYSLEVSDGGSSKQQIQYCPWCGNKLPSSLRDAWFDILDDLGLEPDSSNLSEELRTDSWWKQRCL